jgi:hypothetical protein
MKLMVPAILAAATALTVAASPAFRNPSPEAPPAAGIATVAPGSFEFRLSGEYLKAGRPVDAPKRTVTFRRGFDIMRNEVSAGDYATGTAEREAALAMLDRRPSRRRITLGADKAYDVRGFIKELRRSKVTPHVAVDGHLSKTGKPRATAIDGRTRRHPGYDLSQRCRKRIEEVFGWIKASAGMAKVKLRGCARVGAAFTLNLAAYNLIRLPKLLAAPA